MQTPIHPVRIFISRAGMPTRLRLRDDRNNPNPVELTEDSFQPGNNFDTNIDNGGLIIWEMDPFSLKTPPDPGYYPIKSIVNIVQTLEENEPKYKDSKSVLNGEPVGAGNSFVATVPIFPPDTHRFANYKIVYTLPGDEHNIYEHDPKLVLNT